METITCPHCGKQNDVGDATCIHCGRSMTADAPIEPEPDTTAGAPPTEEAPTASPLQSPPPAQAPPPEAGADSGGAASPQMPVVPATEGGLPSPPDAWAAAEVPKKKSVGLWIGLGLVAIAAVAIIALFSLGNGSTTAHIPDAIAGAPRLTSPEMQQAADQIRQTTVAGGGHLEAGLYGASGIPKYVLVLYQDPPSEITNVSLTDQFDQYAGLLSGSAGTAFDTSGSVKETRDDVEYVCLPLNSSGVTGSFCLFHKEAILGGLVSVGSSDPHAAVDTAQQAYEAATS